MNQRSALKCQPNPGWTCELPLGHEGPHKMHLADLPSFTSGIGRRIVCAALKLPNGTLILGARHYDQAMINTARLLGFDRIPNPEQGFIDQHGKFLTREEAWPIACASHQVIRRVGGNDQGQLFSENLY